MTDALEPAEPANPAEAAAPAPAAVAAPAPAVPSPEVEPPLRAYELPSARQVVTFGLSLAYRASSELRRASIYIGLLTLALLGPPIVFLIELIAHFQVTDASTLAGMFASRDPATVGPLLLFVVLLYLAIVGWLAVSVDGQLIAVALLAAREGDRSFTLREATVRARQVFWRLVRGSILVGLVTGILQLVLGAAFSAAFTSGTGTSVVLSVLGAILVAPLGFLATGVVLGDVGAVEALRRSIRLARTRPRIALVVALFTLLSAAIQLFALSAGLDLFVGAASVVHLGFSGGAGPLAVVILGGLAFVMAFGSLSFTVAALVAAPQVAAFLGLTFYTGGLDRAREIPAGAPKFRWVTRPMIAVIVLVMLGSGYGVASVQGVAPIPRSWIVDDLATVSAGRTVFQSGAPVTVTDPAGDQTWPATPLDILGATYALAPTVPDWVLGDVFDCNAAGVTCGTSSNGAAAFDDGALVFVIRLAGPVPALAGDDTSDVGPVLEGSGLAPAPDLSNLLAPANEAFVTEAYRGQIVVTDYAYQDGKWAYYQTSSRSRWFGNDLMTIIPLKYISQPTAWDAIAWLTRATGTGSSRDELRSDKGPLRPFETPPTLYLQP
ncbi:MAG TPA: hypothetical protein VKR30_07930 [Candidatus Limnocylindrales bacterium]|nr:hypothetical protein [Candidatus Limnocylindrales bacterium]